MDKNDVRGNVEAWKVGKTEAWCTPCRKSRWMLGTDDAQLICPTCGRVRPLPKPVGRPRVNIDHGGPNDKIKRDYRHGASYRGGIEYEYAVRLPAGSRMQHGLSGYTVTHRGQAADEGGYR